MYTSALHLGII